MRINYLEFGEGEPVIVFLHGWQQDSRSFASLIPFLYQEYHLLLPDLPGFGKSEMPDASFSSYDYARVIAEWIKKRKMRKYFLVGHSFGGKIAATIAAQNPKLIRKLVLITSSGIAHPKWFYPLKKLVPSFLAKYFASRDYRQAGALLPIFKTVVKEDLRTTFAEIKVSTLIIWGRKDSELPVDDGKKIHHLIPNSLLKIVSDGHFPFWEDPKGIAKIIDEFIKNEKN